MHLDLKPDNIIVQMDPVAGPTFSIIDYGSIREIGSDTEILGTRLFAAPETQQDDAIPTIACDSYSLGATLYYCLFADFYEGCEEGLRECPKNCPRGVYNVIVGLLNPCPAKRTTVSAAYRSLTGARWAPPPPQGERAIAIRLPTPINRIWPDRAAVIDMMFQCWGGDVVDVLCLAISIADRFAAATKAAPSTEHIRAAYTLAYTLLHPDDYAVENAATRAAISEVASRLGFELYSDTVETILIKEHGMRSDEINVDMLVWALKESWGVARRGVSLYEGLRPLSTQHRAGGRG